MQESEQNFIEKAPEHIPTPEEVHALFKDLIKQEYTEVRRCEDEKGLYLLDVAIPGESADEVTQYEYMRQGRYKEGEISGTAVHITYYESGVPVGGTNAARYLDGKWLIP